MMRRPASVILAIMAACFACGAAAQVKQLTVPNVTVTAPAPPSEPPYLRSSPWESFQRNPYFGRERVEEQYFAQVPCTETRIASATAANCLRGYRLSTGLANYSMRGVQGSDNICDMALDVTLYTVGNLTVEANVIIFDPLKVQARGVPSVDCYVNGFPGYDQAEFQDMNQMTRRGSNWHGLTGEGEAKTIEFSEGLHQCVAIRRPGPRWRGGFVYMLTASICHTDEAELRPDDIVRGLGPLQIRQYDPEGNLVATAPQ
jgi:hypothetical protein